MPGAAWCRGRPWPARCWLRVRGAGPVVRTLPRRGSPRRWCDSAACPRRPAAPRSRRWTGPVGPTRSPARGPGPWPGRRPAAGRAAAAGRTAPASRPKRKSPKIRTSEDTVDLVRRLAVHYPDTKIAGILNRQGRRTPAECHTPPVESRPEALLGHPVQSRSDALRGAGDNRDPMAGPAHDRLACAAAGLLPETAGSLGCGTSGVISSVSQGAMGSDSRIARMCAAS
jgi:hypothetical protein